MKSVVSACVTAAMVIWGATVSAEDARKKSAFSLLKEKFGATYEDQGLPEGQLLLTLRHHDDALPYSFRTTKSELNGPVNNTKGLNQIRMAGCAQFSVAQLSAMLQKLQEDFPGSKPSDVYVFDLREESHGFIQGVPLDWYLTGANAANKGITQKDLLLKEDQMLAELKASRLVCLLDYSYRKGNFEYYYLSPHGIASEKEVVEKAGAHYVRIPVTDHLYPEPRDIDLFINQLKMLPNDAILVFHCRGGWGRTSTFMVLADIWYNHHQASAKEIVNRQGALPNAFNLHHSHLLKPQWKVLAAVERLYFIRIFYSFVHEGFAAKGESFEDYFKTHHPSLTKERNQ
ncbi:MAG: hypothetical protein J0G29_00540 [Alphaproteobacteria bacterium]|nr:hypothetical protein [Alphaproteobacteria bacterium]OJV47110.1 MAG: hypothetical protein BGO28_01545 [Alphaproteobacteria bacterium 43-37]